MIVIPSHIQALIFDLDGTLADTMPIHLESWVKTGRELGANITEQFIQDNAGTPTLDLIAKFNRIHSTSLIPQEVRAIKHKFFKAIKEKQGKITPVQKFYDIAFDMRGKLPMSVGTGSSRKNALESLSDLGASDWWVTIITGSDDVQGKPAPDIFLSCAEAMSVKPAACLVFEDGAAGIQAAQAAGMPFIDVNLHI